MSVKLCQDKVNRINREIADIEKKIGQHNKDVVSKSNAPFGLEKMYLITPNPLPAPKLVPSLDANITPVKPDNKNTTINTQIALTLLPFILRLTCIITFWKSVESNPDIRPKNINT